MAETINRGPNVSIGSLMDGRVEAFDGPSIDYQGVVTPDPRFSPSAKDGVAPGRVVGYFNSAQFIVVDAIPSSTSTTSIAAAQAPSTTQGVTLTLTTAVLGTAANVPVWTPGIPIIPTNTTVPVIVSAIDFGFATGTTASNSSTVVVTDNTLFTPGQWIVIGGAGSGSVTNKALITQVASVSQTNVTTIFISPAAATALNNAPIGQGNLYSQFLPPATQFGPAAASANAAEPYQVAGLAKVFDPRQGLTRNIMVNSPTSAGGTTSLLVVGFDVYGTPMTEVITAVGGTNASGNKAFKYVLSIATQTAGTTVTVPNLTVGAGNSVGFNLRNNKWEYLDIFYSGGFSISNTGWTSAFVGTSTSSTGDVRGTQNLSTILTVGTTGGTAVTPGQPNGVNRLTINCAVEQVSALQATPLTTKALFGVPQA
jgi:hypothetical protein